MPSLMELIKINCVDVVERQERKTSSFPFELVVDFFFGRSLLLISMTCLVVRFNVLFIHSFAGKTSAFCDL